jgi:hypothetical protein
VTLRELTAATAAVSVWIGKSYNNGINHQLREMRAYVEWVA